MKRFILYLVFALLAGIFALQNQRPVQIHLFFWVFPGVSESILIIASVLAGAVLGSSLAWREHLRRTRLLHPKPPQPPKPN